MNRDQINDRGRIARPIHSAPSPITKFSKGDAIHRIDTFDIDRLAKQSLAATEGKKEIEINLNYLRLDECTRLKLSFSAELKRRRNTRKKKFADKR